MSRRILTVLSCCWLVLASFWVQSAGQDAVRSTTTALVWMEHLKMTANEDDSSTEAVLGNHQQLETSSKFRKTGSSLSKEITKDYQFTIGKVTKGLAIASKGISFGGAVVNFLRSFLKRSELDIIKEELNQMSSKLDELSEQIEETANEIKSSVEFNSWLLKYLTWEFTVRNGRDKLSSVMKRMEEAKNREDKQRLAEEFIIFFENNEIEGAVQNIYRITGLDETVTTKNLFQLFCEEKGYNPKELGNLMIVVTDIFLSASQQTLTYYAFKDGIENVGDIFVDHFRMLDDIRMQYELYLWYIMRDIRFHATKLVESVVDEKRDHTEDSELAEDIMKRLSDYYSWYAWSVVVIGTDTLYTNGLYETRGPDYLFLPRIGPDKDKNIVVVWQDIKRKPHSCTDIMKGSTLVFLPGTEGRSPYKIVSSGDIVTSSMCWSSRQRVQDYYLKRSLPYKMPQWIATASYERSIECEDNRDCSDHGRCVIIPNTSSRLCICQSMFDGETCEKQISLQAENKINSMLTSLRLSYGNLTRVPSIVDAYHRISDIDENIKDGQEKTMNILDFLKSIIGSGEVLNKAHYIMTRYSELLKGSITKNMFSRHMDDFLKTQPIDYILVELQNILLGVGLFDGETGDILMTYKKYYIAQKGNSVACTKHYSEDVYRMIQKLAGLDEAVSEAMLSYMKWKLENRTESEQSSIVQDAFSYLSDAKSRHEMYLQRWSKQSCPSLETLDLIQSYCSSMLSFEGLSLHLQCKDEMTPIPDQIECISNGTHLNWNVMPKCEFVWSDWSSWSSCDKTCGNGTQHRRREKPNGESEDDYRECETQDCCQKKYNKWRCLTGECISLDQICDGQVDCADEYDENDCGYLISGDTIVLESSCGGYLSCYCTHNGCGWWTKKKSSCTGRGKDSYARFNIYNNRGVNTAIQYGDIVLFKYLPLSSKWLNCPGNGGSCGVSNCAESPGSLQNVSIYGNEIFNVYARQRQGRCPERLSSCLGEPIKPRDQVYIRHSTNQWLSGKNDKNIWTNNCPGQQLDDADKNCPCEIWIVHKSD